jgi:hypothetical protein
VYYWRARSRFSARGSLSAPFSPRSTLRPPQISLAMKRLGRRLYSSVSQGDPEVLMGVGQAPYGVGVSGECSPFSLPSSRPRPPPPPLLLLSTAAAEPPSPYLLLAFHPLYPLIPMELQRSCAARPKSTRPPGTRALLFLFSLSRPFSFTSAFSD